MGVPEDGMAAASFSLIVAILRTLRDNDLATEREISDLFDAALLIVESSPSAFPTDVQQSARCILGEMRDAFARHRAREQ
jgi:hypothetical protein